MSRVLYRVGGYCARHHRPVLLAWLVGVIAIIAIVRGVGVETSNDLTLPGTGSTDATNLLAADLPKQQNGTVPIVLESTDAPLTSGRYRPAINRAVHSLSHADGVLEAASPFSNKSAGALSKDKRIGYVSLTLSFSPSDLNEDEGNAIIDAADPAKKAGLEVSAGGYLGQEVSKPSTHSSEVIGIVAAMIILLFAFRTAAAMGLPIATAIVGVAIGLSLIGLLGHVVSVPTVAPTLGTMIGLGVGIDYSLFIVTRYREHLHEGMEPDESVARAAASSGSAVVFAGGTVIIALLSLVLANIPIVSALGYSAAAVVLVAVLAATTLLTALLGMAGRGVERFRLPGHRTRARDHRPHGWLRWADGVARFRWVAMLAAVAILVALALPMLDMRLGQQDYGQFPKSTTVRQAYDALDRGFGPGLNGPLLLAVGFKPPAHPDHAKLQQLKEKQKRQQQQAQQQAQQAAQKQTQALIAQGVPPEEAQAQAEQQAKQQEAAAAPSKKQQEKLNQQEAFLKSNASDPRLVQLENKIGKAKDVKSVSPAKVDKQGSAAVFSVIPKSQPTSEATEDLVRDLRDDVIPEAGGNGVTAYVGGTTASYIDLADRIGDKLPSVIAIVVALAFVLLLMAFRTVVVPIQAGLMNLLSVAASYGVLTAVFEKGVGTSLIGLDHAVPIVSFVPLLMFAILFGLSMDYQVFLVSRIQEHHREGGGNRQAVIDGLATSANVITAAALIMVCVFSSFVLNGNPTVKQFGVGMAAAIAIDATIVRCLLVPAVMVSLGESNWWLPRRLARYLPRIGIEGEEGLPG